MSKLVRICLEGVNWLDSKILSIFTWVSHRFQRLTGRTNYFLAKIVGTLYGGVVVLLLIDFYKPTLSIPSRPWPYVVLLFFLMIAITFIIKDFEKEEERYFQNPEVKGNLLMSTREPVLRIAWLYIGLIDFWKIFELNWDASIFLEIYARSGLFLYVCLIYFSEVNPLPPGKSKIREWVEGISSFFAKKAVSQTS